MSNEKEGVKVFKKDGKEVRKIIQQAVEDCSELSGQVYGELAKAVELLSLACEDRPDTYQNYRVLTTTALRSLVSAVNTSSVLHHKLSSINAINPIDGLELAAVGIIRRFRFSRSTKYENALSPLIRFRIENGFSLPRWVACYVGIGFVYDRLFGKKD